MLCCGKSGEDREMHADAGTGMEVLSLKEQASGKDKNKPYAWHPTVRNIQQIAYVRRLESEHEALQTSVFSLSTQVARLKFRIRQIIQAAPRDRNKLLEDLERLLFTEDDSLNQFHGENLPVLKQHHAEMGDILQKQFLLIQSLRQRIGSFELASKSLATESSSKHSIVASQSKSELVSKPSETKSRNLGGSDMYFLNALTGSTVTCGSLAQTECSERSTSFKELRDMYQKGFDQS